MVENARFVLDFAMGSQWLLLVIVGVAIVDAVLPVIPSEVMIITASVAAAAGEQNLFAVIGAAALGALLGDSLSYGLGRGVGLPLRARLIPGGVRHRLFERIEHALHSRGGHILVTARYIPGARTVATLAAGTTGYAFRKFLAFSAIGVLVSSSSVALLGYFGGRAFSDDTLKALLFSFAMALVLAGIMEVGRRIVLARGGSATRSD